MYRQRTLQLLFSLMAFLIAQAGESSLPDMKFLRLDTRDGLSNSQVNCIFRDSRGLVWIGTHYGLNRYDGYRTKSYYADGADATTLPSNYVDHISETADGLLLLRQGLDYTLYDPATDRFERSPDRLLAPLGIKENPEYIFVDAKKNLWVKTSGKGFYRYSPATKKLTHIKNGRGGGSLPPDFYVSSMADCDEGVLVVSNRGSLLCLDGEAGRVKWSTDYVRRHGGHDNESYVVRCGAQGIVWVIAHGCVYTCLSRQGLWFDTLDSYMRSMGIADVPGGLEVSDILLDERGWLWVATDHQGVFVIDTKSRDVRHFLNNKFDETSLCENTIRNFHQDALGRIWIGSYRSGLSQYTKSLTNVRSIELGDINAVCEDRQGNYWLGTNDRGIICYHPQTGQRDFYNRANSGFMSDIIVSSLVGRDGTLWFGTFNGGLIRLRDGRFTNYVATGAPDGLANNNVWGLAEDSRGSLWIATLGGGIQKLDPGTGRFTTLNTGNSTLRSDYMTSLAWNREGWLLAGSSDYYSLVQPQTGKIVNCSIPARPGHNAAMPASNAVMEDSRGLLWQGSTAGACILDVKAGRQWMLDAHTGLLGSNVVAIAEDLRHTMWVVTEHGVSNILPQRADDEGWSFLVHSYNTRDGLQRGIFNQRAITCTHDGLILVGGQEGLDIIHPNLVAGDSTREMPVFSGLMLFGSDVVPGRRVEGRVVLEETLDVCRHLHLKYAENQFTIQLASTSGEVHNRSRFAYRLKGFNHKWISTEEGNPNITYTGLPSGSYTLCVRMLNDDGTMGDDESRLTITIDAPWYRSWWILLAYLVLLVLAVRWLFRRYQEKLRLAQMKLEQENKHKLDEQKQQFYSVLSDELRQPFQNTFESLNDMMSRETDEQRYERQQQVFGHVESILEQVNHLVGQEQGPKLLRPEIREMEITSLDEKLVRDATAYVEQNLDNSDISVETMAQELGMSRVHLYKKLMAVTGIPPSEFIRDIRLRYAEQLLRKSQLNVAEVAYKVGFNNPRYFTKYFKEKYGKIPSEYKNEQGA